MLIPTKPIAQSERRRSPDPIEAEHHVQPIVVRVVDETVEGGVGDGWVADVGVPRFERELGGDHGRALAVAIFDDLQEVLARFGPERREAQSSRMSTSVLAQRARSRGSEH